MDLHTLIPLTYLIAAVTFVLGLKGLSGPKTAVNGNRIAAAGMLLAVAATFFDVEFQSYGTTGLIVTVAGLLIGGAAGFVGARVVKMTAMPQMVALFNGAGGGAAALVSILELMRGLGAGGPGVTPAPVSPRLSSRIETSAAAPPPAPLNNAIIWGIAVIFTTRAP